ncbi:MAG: response regulator [Eubacteriales bacterium]|nr:response regulator [Eubacteriales bacterium]
MLKLGIVEDEAIIRHGIETVTDWSALGFTVVCSAGDGEEGLAAILDTRPDLVLTDICMPKMDGLEMLEKAKSVYDFQAVLLTGYSDFEFARRAIRLGVSEYLLKPIDEDALIQMVRRLQDKLPDNGQYTLKLKYVKDEAACNQYVDAALKRIAEAPGEKINVEAFAGALGITAAYFSRSFKRATGRTFVDVLNDYRIERSKEYLAEPGLKLYEVADRLGFCDYKHFSAVFKKYTGISPSEYLNHPGGTHPEAKKEV